MTNTDITQAQKTDLTNAIVEFSVAPMSPDAATGAEETEWLNNNASKWFGHYKKIPELKKAVDAFATWTIGKGWQADPENTVILESITGWGEDTFNSILFNLIICKKIYGDAFAEIIRDEETGEFINLKILDPATIKIIADQNGLIKRYEQTSKVPVDKKKVIHIFKPEEILHLCNDRVADEIHGTSIIEACEEVIAMRNESMADWRKVLKRNVNPLKIWYVDTDKKSKIDEIVSLIEKTIKDKENLVIPAGAVPKVDVIQAPLVAPLDWIKYLENFFYQAVGIPKIILGGSEEFTEASSKIAYLTFEQVYNREQQEIIADFWQQIGIRFTINQPVSLKNEMLSSENKNTGQTGFQPNDTLAGVGK